MPAPTIIGETKCALHGFQPLVLLRRHPEVPPQPRCIICARNFVISKTEMLNPRGAYLEPGGYGSRPQGAS